VVTLRTPFREGNRNCWKPGYFIAEDVRNGYDVKREPLTDEIIKSIEKRENTEHYSLEMVTREKALF
jgi:hypothetical protein